jgi:2-methylcitrate dehydratase
MGYPSALTAKGWGFQDVLFKGRPIALERALGSYVMENVLFKISFPAEFHAQTAVEAALKLHPVVAPRLAEISRITIETQEPGVRIIDKTGPLANPADRDHCLQYMVAVPLVFGRLTADDYEDEVARDPRIDALRAKMVVGENADFSRDYLDPAKRAIGNAVQVWFADGSCTERVAVDYPIGHRRRRAEGIPQLEAKFERSLSTLFGAQQRAAITAACADQERLEALPVRDFMALWVPKS